MSESSISIECDNPGSEEKSGMSLSELMERAQLEPKSDQVVQAFFDEYEKSSDHSLEEKSTYLRIKWLLADEKWPWLNELAKVYTQRGKKYLAYRCLTESLRFNPAQDDIFDRCEQLKEFSGPKMPGKLKPDACTVSVLMCTYKRPDVIKDAIESVLNQTFRDFELVIVNDGGPVEVGQVVKSFDSDKIKYFRLEKNGGWPTAANKAISQASGKYIIHLDDDDVYYPDHLATMVEALKSGPYDVVYNNTKVVRGRLEDGQFYPVDEGTAKTERFTRVRLLSGGWFGNNNIMYPRRAYSEIGCFNQDLNLTEDWDMWIRLASKYHYGYVDATTTECRMRGDNISVNRRDGALFMGQITLNFYRYCEGKVAYLKYFLERGHVNDAKSLYDKMRSGYADFFHTPELLCELVSFARHFDDKRFLLKLSRDLFKAGPQRWKQELRGGNRMAMIFGALPAVPLKICEKLIVRLNNKNCAGSLL